MYKLFLWLNMLGCHSYHVVEEQKTWWDANEYCKNTYNTDLITITDAKMNANIFSDITINTWIGYYDAYTEGIWEWVGYNKSTFTNWATGQPSSSQGREDCGYLLSIFIGSNLSYWADQTCSNLFHFVCADFNDYPDYYTYKPTSVIASAPTTTSPPTGLPSFKPTNSAPTTTSPPTGLPSFTPTNILDARQVNELLSTNIAADNDSDDDDGAQKKFLDIMENKLVIGMIIVIFVLLFTSMVFCLCYFYERKQKKAIQQQLNNIDMIKSDAQNVSDVHVVNTEDSKASKVDNIYNVQANDGSDHDSNKSDTGSSESMYIHKPKANITTSDGATNTCYPTRDIDGATNTTQP